jgi:hypothetical protein
MKEAFEINFGIIAVNKQAYEAKEGQMIDVLHFVGYENEPSEADYESLYHELETDETFDLIEMAKNGQILLIEAPEPTVEYFKKLYNEQLGEEEEENNLN